MAGSFSAQVNDLKKQSGQVRAEWQALTDKLLEMKEKYCNLETATQSEMKSAEAENNVLKQQVKEWKDKNAELENRITSMKAEFQGKLREDDAIIEKLKEDLVKKEDELEGAIARIGTTGVLSDGAPW